MMMRPSFFMGCTTSMSSALTSVPVIDRIVGTFFSVVQCDFSLVTVSDRRIGRGSVPHALMTRRGCLV